MSGYKNKTKKGKTDVKFVAKKISKKNPDKGAGKNNLFDARNADVSWGADDWCDFQLMGRTRRGESSYVSPHVLSENALMRIRRLALRKGIKAIHAERAVP